MSVYNEVFGILAELYPQVDLASIREEFLLAEPSIPTNEGKDSGDGVNAKKSLNKMTILLRFCYSFPCSEL